MKSQRLSSYVPCNGVNQVLTPQLGDAFKILNCRYSPEGGWVGDVGFESWWQAPASWTVSTATLQDYFDAKVDSCYQWKRQGTNDVYTFVEQNGKLYYVLGNKGQGSTYTGAFYDNDLVVVDSDRYVPKLGDIGSQYINLGSQLLIINGRDRAILFSGDKVWRDFGFVIFTGAADPQDVDTDYITGSELTAPAIFYGKKTVFGLGGSEADVSYEYEYKMSFISDLGAESPLSGIQSTDWVLPAGSTDYRYGVALDLPVGPEGTVARRIYRTKDINSSGGVLYYVKQINENTSRFYVDALPDRYLVDTAPPLTESAPINSDFKYGEVWDNRLWLAKGDKIIYSKSGIFEQFGLLDFFTVPSAFGGDITQVQAFYNNLIVFRESAINIVSFGDGEYSMSTITSTVGTTAPNSVVVIPQLGVVFMNEQGIYMLTGGLNGGASLDVQKISNGIDKELKRRNMPLLHKTVAAYSSKEREVWMHYPTADSTVPDTGAVLHLIPQTPMWSFRLNESNAESGYWSAMTTTIDGCFLLGTSPEWTIALNQTTKKFGPLQVMSNSNTWGQQATISASNAISSTVTITDLPNAGHEWQSEWYAYQNSSVKTRYYSVELRILSFGDNGFNFYYSTDYAFEETSTATQKQAKSETVFTTKEDAVFGPADASVTKVPFKVSQGILRVGRLITLRFDVNTQLVDQFKFGIRTTNEQQFHLVSFNLLSDYVAMPALNQSTRLQKGQAR